MTANTFSDDVQNSLAAGMDTHISRPIDVSVLAMTMRSFVTTLEASRLRQKFLSRGHFRAE